MHGRTKRSTQRAGSNNTTAVKPPEIHQKKYLFFFSCRGCALPCSTKGFSLSVLPCLQRDQGHRGTSTGTSTAAELGSSSLCCSAPARDRALLSTVLLQRGLGLTVTPGLWLHASTQNSGCRWVSKLCFSEVLGGYIKQNKTQQYLSS